MSKLPKFPKDYESINNSPIINVHDEKKDTILDQTLKSSRRVEKMNEALIISKDSRTKKIELSH